MSRPARPLILATASPRRRTLFRVFGIPYRIVVPDVREIRDDSLAPETLVTRNARLKARAAARRIRHGVVIAADTVVVLRGRVFGKPQSLREATRMLQALSGKTHRVLTAVCVLDLDAGRSAVDVAQTRVTMRALPRREITRYLRTISPWDKAGAYAVQDVQGMLIDRIHGSLSNVVGFPLHVVKRQLMACGLLR